MGPFTLLGGRYRATGTEQRLKGWSAIQGVHKGAWSGGKLRPLMKMWNLSGLSVTFVRSSVNTSRLDYEQPPPPPPPPPPPTYAIVTFFHSSEPSTQFVNCTCTDRAVQLKPEIQKENSWASSAAALKSRRLCYRPAVFYRHLSFIAFKHAITFFPSGRNKE